MSVADLEIHEENALSLEALLKQYREDSQTQLISTALKSGKSLTIKGFSGSLDAIIAASIYQLHQQSYVFVMNDKEEASYFRNDLQFLLPQKDILLFPTSYKKPYEFTQIENANVLQRAEVLNQLNQKVKEGELIVTYPDALNEKVINHISLTENTLSAKIGEALDVEFVSELLQEYDFEKTDFVYEAGQYSVRGGIIDIYSFANELPYRLELFGDEIESIRTFDPLTQLSVEEKAHISIIPNTQTKLLHEVRESFFRFIPQNSILWFKDFELTVDTIAQSFRVAKSSFEEIMAKSNNTQVSNNPEDLFETRDSFMKVMESFVKVEFGNRFYLDTEETIQMEARPQPSFNKDFNLLAEELDKNYSVNITSVIVAEYQKQLSRIRNIFEEIDPMLPFKEMNLSLRGGFVDKHMKLALYTDHQIFERYHRYKEKKRFSKSKALTLKELRELKVGDYMVHVDHGIGRFGGMAKQEVSGKMQEAIRLIYRDNDLLYVGIHSLHKVSKYSGQDTEKPKMSKLGSVEWENKKKKAKKKVKDIAAELIRLYAKRRAATGFAHKPDDYMQHELESSFIYEDTPDQAKATEEVKKDMELQFPMDRLVCGDVGFGKTEVAIRAAFKAACSGKQVAVLVPTTILAMQHYRTFKERLGNLPCEVDYVNRFRTTKQVREIMKRLEKGEIDILIGTHRIVGKDVKFKDLGLLIIDEEQKFGVKTKDKLKEMRVNVDVLTMTATPIPRTLQFSLLGARDLSIIGTPPPNRQPVTTELHTFSDRVIRDAVRFELQRGGQVFIVHNRIKDIETIANTVLALVPDARVVYAHGQMEGPRLEKIMHKFMDGDYDVLVSTNIIESGLDIPNANTIIINRAHMFGLSDLHQMRGRVGRSNKKAYCYLLTPPTSGLPPESRRRLSAMEEFTDLGDGFKVAMRDLDIRGAGNMLGGEQSGFISDLGFDMYNQILEDAVKELKENEFRELFKKELEMNELKVDCHIETDFEILIPEEYVSNISERLNLYIKADDLKNEEELQQFKKSLIDRFGPLPVPVADMLKVVRLRWKGEKLGFEKLMLKSGNLKAYLAEHDNADYYQSAIFGKILKYVQAYPMKCKLKESKKRVILIIEDMDSVEVANGCLEEILA
ncbi:MAG: transcription-repair coupling factor [Flammeovirgaceae bacterium]